jgi:Domain of unknown function (DUF4276)
MPKIALVADGVFDQGAIAVLIRNCAQGVTVVPRRCDGRNFARALGILKELERRDLVDFAIWATDSEDEIPREVEDRMHRAIKGASLKLRVCCVPVVRMIEAWLLADEAAVHSVCGRSRVFNRPESLSNPKTELRRILGQRPYTPVVAESIASAADVETIARRCASFRKLRDCLVEASSPRRRAAAASKGRKRNR